jgi:hypothetical protein
MEKIKVKISTNSPTWSYIRQTPGSKGVWGNYQFYIDDDTKECDWWVVIDGLTKEESVLCSPVHTILITAEPQSIKKYENKFVQQFHTVITTQKNIQAPHVINLQLLPWLVGAHFNDNGKRMDKYTKSFDELTAMGVIPKSKIISIISSSKKTTRGHRQRLKFVAVLKEYFGDRLDVFGSGINQIPDKWDGLAPYKYHIAIENSVVDDYWTEKLADCYLAESYPFYYGCPNIFRYFPDDALSIINIHEPKKAILIIEEAIKNSFHVERKLAIIKARQLILERYQVFPALCEIMRSSEVEMSEIKIPIVISPERKNKKTLFSRIYAKITA